MFRFCEQAALPSVSEAARALCVGVRFTSQKTKHIAGEAERLLEAAGLSPVHSIRCQRAFPHPKSVLGPGKLEEIKEEILVHRVTIVLFDCQITASQKRTIESTLGCSVLDRTELILHIFAQRAQTHEGKLQVELAATEYQMTRLVRGWTHLERQKGGIGLRAGPGETQLEIDRRLLQTRMKRLRAQLKRLSWKRAQDRTARVESAIPMVSLVGYTNSGKSSLLNRLTGATVPSEDQLFVTLNTTLRGVPMQGVGQMLLADTVGFIQQLPHELVDAFQSTLEDVQQADLLLVVVDISDDDNVLQQQQVQETLDKIGAKQPKLLVFNKVDQLVGHIPSIERNAQGYPEKVWISVKTGFGLETLLSAINEHLNRSCQRFQFNLHPHQSYLRALLHDQNAVIQEEYLPSGQCCLDIMIVETVLKTLVAQAGESFEQLICEGKRFSIC